MRALFEKDIQKWQDYTLDFSCNNKNGLKKNELKPWKVEGWGIPTEQNSQFVANMERVLVIYKLPYDQDYPPVACMDESPKQLIEDVATSGLKPGQDARVDYEYIRHGMVNIVMVNEPLKGSRMVEVTEFKTKKDWARFMQRISEEMFPQAKKISLVMDNIKSHDPSAFYEVFKLEEAK